jgi:hypothetical protein
MFELDPEQRIRPLDAMAHEYFDSYMDVGDEDAGLSNNIHK